MSTIDRTAIPEGDNLPEPLDPSMPWANVSLYTCAELKDVEGTHFLTARMDVGMDADTSEPWVTIGTNYMTSRSDGTLAEHKEELTFSYKLLPQLRQMLESLEVRAAALSRVAKELEAPVRLATDVPARRMVRTPRVS